MPRVCCRLSVVRAMIALAEDCSKDIHRFIAAFIAAGACVP
jgi:hypothetical protein